MDLRIRDNFQLLRNEVSTHWKTGVAMTGVAVVVGRVYGKKAVFGVILITVSNYQIIGKQIRILTWASLRKTLIAVVLFGNSYYNIINPQIMTTIAFVLVLVDNFQLSTLIDDLSTQNRTLEENNKKLIEAHESLKALERELLKIQGNETRIAAAQEAQEVVIPILVETIPERIQDLPARLTSVSTLLKEVMNSEAMKELERYKEDLRTKIKTLLESFGTLTTELAPITQQAAGLAANLESTIDKLQTNVTLTREQIEALKRVLAQLKGSRI